MASEMCNSHELKCEASWVPVTLLLATVTKIRTDGKPSDKEIYRTMWKQIASH